MTFRPDREDFTAQESHLRMTRASLSVALSDLALAAKKAATAAASNRAQPDLPAVYAAINEVRRIEEAVDMAALDLNTARGEDA